MAFDADKLRRLRLKAGMTQADYPRVRATETSIAPE